MNDEDYLYLYYLDGKIAFENKQPRVPPYDLSLEEMVEWLRGWDDAQKEKEG